MVKKLWSMLYYLRNNPQIIKISQIKRGLDPRVVDEARLYDELWRETQKKLDEMRHLRNVIARKIGKLTGEERRRAVEEARRLNKEIERLEQIANYYKRKRDEILLRIPNVIHESVPVGKDESDNVPIRYYGKPKVWKGFLESFKKEIGNHKVEYEVIDYRPIGHADMVEMYGWADTARAAKVAGSRFYYLMGDLVWLEYALILYALDYLASKGFKIVEPPFMMRRAPYEGVISFQDFEEMIYKIENEDLYLIATAEHPLAAMHMNEVLTEDELPLLYAGVSPCFRKEAGAHGKDTKGIFRVHQFNKVEQFVFTKPEDSWDWLEKLYG